MNPGLLAFVSAFFVCALVAPIAAVIARRIGLIDRPDNYRKLHSTAIPMVGGPALLVSGLVAFGIVYWLSPDAFADGKDLPRFLFWLLMSAASIVILGVLDDRFRLRGRQKLLGQIIVAMMMVPSGLTLSRLDIFGHQIEFGDLSPLITMFWILGAINALNLIDGVDGLASTTGIVLSLSVAAVSVAFGDRLDGVIISLILAGALSGFLIYNFPPARLFLGDSGSMLIGLILGAVAMKYSLKQYTAMALVMPTAIWAIPIFDVLMAITRRKLTGRSIYTTDRGHLHHCLQRRGHSGTRLLLVVAALCGMTGLGAVASAFFGNDLIAVIAVVTAIALLIVTRSFGHAEMLLLANRLKRFSSTLVGSGEGQQLQLHHEQVRLHGDHQWQDLWGTLTEFARRYEMDWVELMVNLPSVGEEYHAIWRKKSQKEALEAWRTEIPLVVSGMRAGHIKVVAAVRDGSMCEWMSELIGGLRPFELQLVSLIEQVRERKTVVKIPRPEPMVLPMTQRTPA